jgi:hypothetical protein
LDVNIAALRADNLDSTHRWRFITLGEEMLEIGHWKNTDFHPFFYTEKLSKTISH